MGLYRSVVRPLLFRVDPETMHGLTIGAAELAGASAAVCSALAARAGRIDERLAIEVAGLRMHTPLGLAAGFDKCAHAVPLLSALGFGHVEVGSISAEPSQGNARPRLFRLPQDGAIVVHYGLPNDGADRVAQRLQGQRHRVPLGINVVSTNRGERAAPVSDDGVIADYLYSVRRLQPHADYLCLNLSCPNTREGRDFFHEPRHLSQLLDGLVGSGIVKPLFLKVAPFARTAELEMFLETAAPYALVSGFSVNLPSRKPAGLSVPDSALARMPGAVSGKPAATAADHTIAELFRRMPRGRYRLIGSGGMFSAQDAYRKIRLGASMVQLMTALVYEGPGVIGEIHRGLARLLEADGFRHVADAVGVDAA